MRKNRIILSHLETVNNVYTFLLTLNDEFQKTIDVTDKDCMSMRSNHTDVAHIFATREAHKLGISEENLEITFQNT